VETWSASFSRASQGLQLTRTSVPLTSVPGQSRAVITGLAPMTLQNTAAPGSQQTVHMAVNKGAEVLFNQPLAPITVNFPYSVDPASGASICRARCREHGDGLGEEREREGIDCRRVDRTSELGLASTDGSERGRSGSDANKPSLPRVTCRSESEARPSTIRLL
jgi:hypothetical protein